MKKLLLACMLALGMSATAQTVLINPATDGGFESGTTLAANGWSSVVPSTDVWVVGAAPTPTSANCGYISKDGGTSWSYSQTSTYSHLYRDVTVPAGELKGILSFDWKVGGEGTTTSDWDNLKIYLIPTSTTPTSTAAVTGGTQLSGSGAINGMYKLNSTNWNSESFGFAFPSAGTWRIVFTWKSDGSTIANPPAAVDNISLTSNLPGNFISVATGNWGDAATWDANAVPTSGDNVTVSTGNAVTINATGQAANNLTIDGTLAYGTTPTSFAVGGNLNVNAGGVLNVFSGTTGKTLNIAGNIVNNGTIDLSVGTTTAGNLTLNGSTVQNISGTGSFNNGFIRNLTFSNTATATPNINWDINNIKVAYNLNLTGARINLGSNKLTFGNSAAGNTLTAPAGTGFLPGGKFSRWWTATATGSTITAGADPTATTSLYPFITSTEKRRPIWITRTNTTGAAAGELAVVYNDAATMTTGLSIVDGTYTVTERYDGNWAVTNEGTAVNASSYTIAAMAQDAFAAANGNVRVLNANSALAGAHQNGTTTPTGQRITVPQADLLAAPIYLGIASEDLALTSVASGDWNNPATWSSGAVPTCDAIVNILSTHNVTVNSAAAVSKRVTINSGGTLTIASGDLTVGCTLKNNTLLNNGTLTVSGGILNVNGNVNNANGSTFNQSGGDIIVDGNDAGVVSNSVASGTNIFGFGTSGTGATLNLTGGKITIVDPHAATSSAGGTSNGHAFAYWGNGYRAGVNHTIQLGDGVSTDAGGHTSGFQYNTWPGTGYFIAGNLVVNLAAGTNRLVVPPYTVGVEKDLTVTSGELRLSSSRINGNIVNNGTLTSTGTLELALWGASLTTSSSVASTNAQTITGSGVFRNSATTTTANLASFLINNTSAGGVTLDVPLSASGTLTLTAGKVNTTATNLLTLGTATAAGTLSGGSNTAYINGPFARTIGGTNANTNYIHYPVGKATYAPIWLAPATTAVSNMKAEAFESNTGMAGTGTVNLSATRRWEAPLVSGTITDINVRIGDANIGTLSIPVQASSATGIYTAAFGDTATYTASTATVPATVQSTAVATSTDYTGYLSYAEKDPALGTVELAATDNSVKVYPNPFTEILNISDVREVASVSITDMSGRIVKTIAKPTAQLSLGDLKSGMYLVTLKYKNGTVKSVKAIKK